MKAQSSSDAPKRVISSGNAELDSRLGGGLPAGSLVLIEGSSGAGKSVLSQQILKGALSDGNTAALFTTENTVKSLVSQMESIDLDIFDFLLLGKLRAYPVELSHLGDAATAVLLHAMKQEQGHQRDLIIIDSLTSAIAHIENKAPILSFFESCKRLCSGGMTIIITLHAQAIADEFMNPLRSVCDAHLALHTEHDGNRLVKTLEVAKIRGAASVTGSIVGFDVEPGWGMRVIPISKARG